MYRVDVCLRDARRTVVASHSYATPQQAIRGRLQLLESWAGRRVLVSSPIARRTPCA